MRDELYEAFSAAIQDDEIRAIVITGAGRGFCAGADMDVLTEGAQNAASYRTNLREQEALFHLLFTCPKPVIAAINGPAAGIGLVLTFYCDLRFIAAGAKITMSFSQRGLIAEYGSAWLLPRLIGHMNALDLMMSSRVVTSEEVAKLGLAREMPAEKFLESVQSTAQHLAESTSPASIRVIKHQVLEAYDQSFGEALTFSIEEMAASIRRADFKEGVLSYVEKRKPRFTGR